MSFAEELDASLAEDVLESHGGSSRVASEALATECIVVVKSCLAIRSSSTLEEGFGCYEVELRETDDLEVIHPCGRAGTCLPWVLDGIVALVATIGISSLGDTLGTDVVCTVSSEPREEGLRGAELCIATGVSIAPDAIEPCVVLVRGEYFEEGL